MMCAESGGRVQAMQDTQYAKRDRRFLIGIAKFRQSNDCPVLAGFSSRIASMARVSPAPPFGNCPSSPVNAGEITAFVCCWPALGAASVGSAPAAATDGAINIAGLCAPKKPCPPACTCANSCTSVNSEGKPGSNPEIGVQAVVGNDNRVPRRDFANLALLGVNHHRATRDVSFVLPSRSRRRTPFRERRWWRLRC